MKLHRPESEVLRECLKYLKQAGIFHIRMNVGAVKTESRFVRFGTPGCADILIFVKNRVLGNIIHPVWAECKSSVGKQSTNQIAFQKLVESEGHKYLTVRSVEELIEGLK